MKVRTKQNRLGSCVWQEHDQAGPYQQFSAVGLVSHALCTGCTSCASVCAFGAIEMCPDARGFLVPRIDESKCRSCGACAKVCPILKAHESVAPRQVWIAKAKDDMLRQTSASGGAFTVLAHKILKNGGVVYGAGWNEDFTVSHRRAVNKKDLEPLRGSKYVQSDLRGIFKSVKTDLVVGKRVLFSGTPCQVAGLNAFLGKSYDNLIIAALICHSITSPDTWAWYLEDLRKSAKSKIIAINFRDKSDKHDGRLMSIKFADSSEDKVGFLDANPYARVFFSLLNTRESCFSCNFRSNRCGADFIIGDYWTPNREHVGLDDGRGVSAVVALTSRAEDFLRTISDWIIEPRDYANLVKGNPYLEKSVTRRDFAAKRFMSKYRACRFDEAVGYALSIPWYIRLACYTRRIVGALQRRVCSR